MLGRWVSQNNSGNKQGRRGVAASGRPELFVPPLSVPKIPSRMYFLFQESIQTSPEDLEVRNMRLLGSRKRGSLGAGRDPRCVDGEPVSGRPL